MKVAILAGGLGTRLAEETTVKPKPMVEIGGIPLLVHIMQTYVGYGHRDFVIAGGYKWTIISEYFALHHLEGYDSIRLLDTGQDTNTGGRVKRLIEFIKKPFMLTYGDGLSNVDLRGLLNFHQTMGRLVTLTAVHPPARFGHMIIDDGRVGQFREKAQMDEGWINGGFMVVQPEVLPYISGDGTSWEYDVLPALAAEGELAAFKHEGFWQCCDTMHDKQTLQRLWEDGAPWLQ